MNGSRSDQRDLDGLAGRRLVLDGVTLAGAGEGLAQRRRRGIHLDAGGLGLFARADEERLVLVVAVEADGDEHARAGHAVADRRVADLGRAQQLLQLHDPALLLALLLAGGVVAAVLLEIALFAPVVDLLGHGRAVVDQSLQLVRQPVVGVLGQPGDGGVVGRGHGGSPGV